MKVKTPLVLMMALSMGILVSGCGGDSSSNTTVTMTERFVGKVISSAPVQGLAYTSAACESSCITNAQGEYFYYEGQTVTFTLPPSTTLTVKAAPVILPNDFTGETGLTDAKSVRLARLLHSLDADNNVANGLDISAAATTLPTACGFSTDDALTACQLTNLASTATTITALQQALAAVTGSFQFKILHINDHHSHTDPDSTTVAIGDSIATLTTGGFANVVAGLKELSAAATVPVLKLHAGDAITGTVYFSLTKGESDAAALNQACFDAITMGNHEFDSGDAGLVKFLDYLKAGSCPPVALSANTQPQVGTSPLTSTSATDYLKPYTIKTLGGQKVGIIGITVADKTKASSSPDATTVFLDEASTAQKYINELKGLGVNKIVILSHHGYDRDLALAAKLTGVDVIVGGDSHSLLGNAYNDVSLSPEGDYPSFARDAEGKRVCVAQAWQYSQIIGELDVKFNDDGEVVACSGIPHLLVSQLKTVDSTTVNADAAAIKAGSSSVTAVQTVMTALQQAPFSLVTPDAATNAVLKPFQDQKTNFANKIIGVASENLCFERVPGQGRSTIAGCKDLTWQRGSDISNIVAKGFLEMSKSSDVCIQNGGGVRIDVPAGNVSVETAYTLLPFANTLTEITMTGQQIKAVLEDAMDATMSGSTGSYPYAAGLRWTVNLSEAKGSRISNLEVNSRVAGEWSAIDLTKSYKVVTNSFTASGQDGYLTFADIDDSLKTNTYLDYAQSFVDYVEKLTAAGQQISKLPVAEYSTQYCIPDINGKYCTQPATSQ
ncbi:5'-nucleotidase C-terminal domain-containing protein [Thiofilum flexile]|uniref:5'-nucleotidase C-terminal domain-containing protein n=1 Tax=Thiofilum flexile TaxID=125627 RepID=UPI0003623B48|nr:5'-nucleotidase C-terminal domain-containing protein [Thiofilum flexile]